MNPALRKAVFRRSKRLIGEKKTRDLQHMPFRLMQKVQKPPFGRVSNFTFVEGTGFFINGWILDPQRQVANIEIVVGSGHTVSIKDLVHPVPRLDLLKKYGLADSHPTPGFSGFIPDTSLSVHAGERVSLRLTLKSGRKKSIKIRPASAAADSLGAIRKILNAAPSNIPEKRDLFDFVYGPAISAIWSLRKNTATDAEVIEYNQELADGVPEVSLIVPIYGRYDFIEYQLSQFVNDPHMFKQEIIYVIDDPRLHSEVKTVCDAYQKLYRVPFKVLYLSSNMGFAGANNIGVSHTRGRLVLLINSDVMPAKSGWLDELVRSAGDRIDSLMIGVRLLYEDDSIQHDGMKFYASPFVNDLWTNIHPNKGMPRSLVKASSSLVDAEAITGACILMSKRVYTSLGGFDENYILGDYEDSDLCMRARESGIGIKMNSAVALYHLERQSQSLVSPERWKTELTYYNCWYHTKKWNSSIQQLQGDVVNG